MAQTNDEIIQIIDSIYAGDGRKAVKRLNETIDRINYEARLATLDDCKTLLERVLSETQDDNHKGWAGPTYGLKRALAELEALRNADDKK